jgi:hypothetical protein
MDWRPFYYNDSTLVSTGDTISTGDNRIIRVSGIHIKYTASNTVGNRTPVVRYTDSDGDIVLEVRGGAVTAASQVRYYNFGTSLSDLTSFTDTDHLTNALPDVWMPHNTNLVVLEESGLDPGSDLMELQVFGEIAGEE